MKTKHTLRSISRRVRNSSSIRSLDELIATLKKTVSEHLADQYANLIPAVLVSRAVNDAEELARTTDFPHLFLPALAEEKVSLMANFLISEGEHHEPHALLSAA